MHAHARPVTRKGTPEPPRPALALVPGDEALESARRTLALYARTLEGLARALDPAFARALALIRNLPGRVAVAGIGRSGLVARKIAATLASGGTPAFFLPPAEAFHGDLGMLTRADLALLVSHGGETVEIVRLLPSLRRLGVPVVALTGDAGSTVARAADLVLSVPVEREACAHDLLATTSAMATLAMGDALAVALAHARDFQPADFIRLHPGSTRASRLESRVKEAMHRPPLPVVGPGDTLDRVVMEAARGRLGLVLVLDQGAPVGVIGDGDLRRALAEGADPRTARAVEVMHPGPPTTRAEAPLALARARLAGSGAGGIVVVDAAGRVEGVLLRAGA